MDSDWTHCGNWDQGFPPLANQDVFIPMTGTCDPLIERNAVARSISISAGAALFLNHPGLLHINGAGAPPFTDGIAVGAGSELYINTGSKLEITNPQDDGIQNSGITVCSGELIIENSDYGIYNFNNGELLNDAGGHIHITNIAYQGILNNLGLITNAA